MSHYLHLTQYERYQISALLKNKTSISVIARILNRHRSAIYREIKRNTGKRGYRPAQAERFSSLRKSNNQATLSSFFWQYVKHLLLQYHSPEQIIGRLKLQGWSDVGSVESVYQYIYKDKQSGGELHRFLRCQKTYRKRYFKGNDRRGKIPERNDISERPAIIELRTRIGDFEGDTVVGKNHKGVLLTFVDRTTRFTKLCALPNRKAACIAQASIHLLHTLPVYSITFDNGKEFTHHAAIADGLNTTVYFANPYHSWERGTNENTNGLIRQFFNKERSLDNIDAKEIDWVENLLNNRPRKVLGYLTPFEAMAKNSFVALHT